MNYKLEDLQKCYITKDMLQKWFWEKYSEKDGDKWNTDEIDFKVFINEKELLNPLIYLEKVQNFINEQIDEHCKIIDELEEEIERRANIKANKILEDKINNLERVLTDYLIL